MKLQFVTIRYPYLLLYMLDCMFDNLNILNFSKGLNYRVTAKSCREAEVTCESINLLPEGAELTDCKFFS